MDNDTPRDLDPQHRPPADEAELALWERFLAHEATPADEARMRAWSNAPGRTGPSAESVRRALREDAADGAPPAVDAHAMVLRLRSQLALEHGSARDPVTVIPARRARRVAAAVACAAAAVIMILGSARSKGATTPAIRLGLHDTGTYQTGPNERLHVRFPDGTDIAAAPNTSVRVTGPIDHRSVYIRGEAYVDASDDAARPVVVHAANAVVENGGARFAVRTDIDAREVRIAVTTGVVLAGDSGAPLASGRVLTRGTVGVVSARGTTRAFRPGDRTDAVAWATGSRMYDLERMRDELPRVRRTAG